MTSEARRNALYPCGSGKKYKKCCLLKEQASKPLTKELLGQACRQALSLLLDFAVKFPALKAPPLGRPVPVLPSEEAQNTLHSELLMPWILCLWHPPESQDEPLPSERTVAARFLKHEGQKLDGITRRYIEAARLEPFSYWQVEGVSPGTSLLLKDMVTGEERPVADISTSKMAAKWDIFFAQVVGLDGMYILNGLGLYPLSPYRFRQSVVAFVEGIRKQVDGSVDRLCLLAYQTEFVTHYLRCVEEVLHPTLPELQNMDGDKLVFTKSRYTFQAPSRKDVITGLTSLRDMEKETDEEGQTRFVWLALPKTAGHKDKVSKAYIRVGSDWLESESNSEVRDTALRRRLLKQMGSLITHESTNLQPFHPGMAGRKPPDSAGQTSRALDLASLPEKDRRRIEAVFDQQYMSWLDDEIPMLGGKTPRETARSSQGKKQVAAMINDWENMESRAPNPQFRFDFNKLRAELGIDME